MFILEFAYRLHHENRRLGGDGRSVLTIELDRRTAEAVCWEISKELEKVSIRSAPFSLALGEVFLYHGASIRIVEKVS